MTPPVNLPLGPLMVDIVGESLTSEEADFLRQPAVGAVILFARNYRDKAQLRALTAAIKALRSPPLLIAADQEGGAVQRFQEGFAALPAAAAFGAEYNLDAAAGVAMAEAGGFAMASEVRECGVDFSFAPVLDCANARNAMLGSRAFHHEPAAVAALAGAYVAGMRRAGMAATGKHFPGHGGVVGDSHFQLPVDSRTFAEVESRDLIPFARLAGELGGVMTAHIEFERIHEQAPTYSPFWLRGILRGKLGFDGVIFSDDLSMKGAGEGDIVARCTAALDAGCDMALVCNAAEDARAAAAGLGDGFLPVVGRLEGMRGN